MKPALAALLAVPLLAFAHGHPASVDANDPEAWKYKLCGEMATVALQALHDRDKDRAPKTWTEDGGAGPRIANAITRRVFEEPQISSPKKAESFGRAYCMEQLQQ
ncbi:MAG: hypothetical protein Q7U97_12420 [Rhodocyclaceae bacterium]|jgi:hypothetical protein|nr:hypothetical protein [Rhodocyclaceae bacterium]